MFPLEFPQIRGIIWSCRFQPSNRKGYKIPSMPSRKLPKSISEAIAVMTSPYLGRQLSGEEVAAALESIRPPMISMGDLAAERGITRQAMLVRLNKANIKPAGKGGRSGNEYLYNTADVIGL